MTILGSQGTPEFYKMPQNSPFTSVVKGAAGDPLLKPLEHGLMLSLDEGVHIQASNEELQKAINGKTQLVTNALLAGNSILFSPIIANLSLSLFSAALFVSSVATATTLILKLIEKDLKHQLDKQIPLNTCALKLNEKALATIHSTHKLPSELTDPVSFSLIDDPVMLYNNDGLDESVTIFNRSVAEELITRKQNHPLTGRKVEGFILLPELKKQIQELRANPEIEEFS